MFFSSPKIKIKGKHPTSVFRHQHNEHLREAIKDTIKESTLTSVLNLGARQVDTDKEGTKYKKYFNKEVDYYTLDSNKDDSSPNHYDLDLHDLSTIDKQFDLVLCMNVLEHVKNPFAAADQIKTIIKDGGYLFIASPFFYPIHKSLDVGYSDYWRFTDDGLKMLFPDFKVVWLKETDSVIKVVDDRNMYWDDLKSHPSGYSVLFKK